MSGAKPSPVTNLTATPEGSNSVKLTWQAGWATISGPQVGPTYHSLLLYLSETAYQGDAKVQVQINGVNQFSAAQSVTALFAKQTEQVFTFNGTWPIPPTVTVIMTNYVKSGSNVRDLYLNSAVYDGQALSGVSNHFTGNTQYKFTA